MYELRSATVPSLDEARDWTGARVDDIRGRHIGRLLDVLPDPMHEEPGWLMVRFSARADRCTLIPLRSASRARVAGSQLTKATRGGPASASARACASAPARGGSMTAASTPASSIPVSGRRKRSLVSVMTRLRPGAARQPAIASSLTP